MSISDEQRDDVLAMTKTAKSDLASLSRVSHRIALIDTTTKLSQVLDKLLPKLLKRIGDNNINRLKLQQDQNGNNEHVLLLNLYQQIHDKLVEIFSHVMKRVRDDDSCTLPCLEILKLLVTTSEEDQEEEILKEGTTDETATGRKQQQQQPPSPPPPPEQQQKHVTLRSQLSTTDVFTVNLALTFLSMGLPRLPGQQAYLNCLPYLIVLCHDSRLHQLLSSSKKQQHYQIANLLLTCIAQEQQTTGNNNNNNNNNNTTTSSSREAGVDTTKTTLSSALEWIRTTVCESGSAGHTSTTSCIAATLYDLFLDVLLVSGGSASANDLNSTVPPPGLSQSGQERLLSNKQTTNQQRRSLAVLEWIAPQRQYDIFRCDHTRALALMVVATATTSTPTGDPQSLHDKANTYLKQYLMNNNKKRAGSDVNNNRLLSLAMELIVLCAGGSSNTASSSSSSLALLLGHCDYIRPESPQALLTTQRRPVSESTVTILSNFVATKILDENPQLFETTTATADRHNHQMDEEEESASNDDDDDDDDHVLAFASLVIRVTKRCLDKVTGALSPQRAKPYVASAKLLSSLSIRLGQYECSSSSSSSDDERLRVVDILSEGMKIACNVVSPMATSVHAMATRSGGSGGMIRTGGNVDGSVAVRDICYGIIATLARSPILLSSSSSAASNKDNILFSQTSTSVVESATMLFGCAAREEERLRPRAVEALDALLTAYCRIYAISVSETDGDDDDPAMGEETKPLTTSDNPWLAPSNPSLDKATQPNRQRQQIAEDRAALAKSLLPLLWSAAQSYNPKASRVAAARWTGELLKRLNPLNACHLLCFLAGDSDATAAALARDALGLPKKHSMSTSSISDDDLVAIQGTYSDRTLPEFSSLAEIMFSSADQGIIRRFWDFSLSGKAATLRFCLFCLLGDLYGGGDKAVELFLSAITETIAVFESANGLEDGKPNTPLQSRASIDLLDECSACLLATLSASQYARTQISGRKMLDSFGIENIERLVLSANSSRSRRYLAACCGKLFEDSSIWSGSSQDSVDEFQSWVSMSHLGTSLSTSAHMLGGLDESHLALGRMHGSTFLGAQAVRSFRLRAARSKGLFSGLEGCWKQVAEVLTALGKGIMHREEILGNACADGLAIALSYDSDDCPSLDSNLYECTASILSNIAKSLKKYGHSDTVDPLRVTRVIRASGVCLSATTTASGLMSLSADNSVSIGLARLECVSSLFDLLGSMANRKEDEIAIVVGEALSQYADAYSPPGIAWSNADANEWPVEFQESFANELSPHEHVLYVLMRKIFKTSSPHVRTSCAPALLAIAAKAALTVTADASSPRRSIVEALLNHLSEVQDVFIKLLADPKSKQLARESCCLGLAACRGLLGNENQQQDDDRSMSSSEALNHKLLWAFGQTTNFGGSAFMETEGQAAERRRAEGRQTDEGVNDGISASTEAGGAAGVGEAALGAYREMAAASVALGRHDIMYALLLLSVNHSYWFSAEGKYRYSASSLLGENSFVGSKTSSQEFRNALRPHLGKLLPRILRACHDPNKQTREQMKSLWAGLTGGGAEGRLAISQHLLSTMDSLIKDTSSRFWRARVGACGALSEVVVGREWCELGGGGPIFNEEELYGESTTLAGIRLLRLWIVAMRAMDDVQGSVRESGESLARAVRGLTIRLCDPSVDVKSSGAKRGRDESARKERESVAAAGTVLWWLVHRGLNQTCELSVGVCLSTLVGVIDVVRPKVIEASLPELIRSLLMAMSGLEPAAFNYLQLRVNNGEALERIRLELAQRGPLAEALNKCLELLPFASFDTQQRVVPELDSALRQSAGFATRAATADAVSTLCSTCPTMFSFSGASIANPAVRLLRAFYYASERERGENAKDKMIHAIGNLAALCPGSSVRSLALKACERYRSSTGNNYDQASRRASAATLRAIAVRAANHFKDGGESDVWCRHVLPIAYLGRNDDDSKIASLFKEVWEDGGSNVSLSAGSSLTNSFGTRLEEKLLSFLVGECVAALNDVSWSRRVSGSCALVDLCEIGVLAPVSRSVAASSSAAEAMAMARAKRRAEASKIAMQQCIQLLCKPRIWRGKSDVLRAATLLASKWTAAMSSMESDDDEKILLGWSHNGGSCPWIPVVLSVELVNDLFVADGWFQARKAAENRNADDTGGENSLESDMNERGEVVSGDDDDEEDGKIDFRNCDEVVDESEADTSGSVVPINDAPTAAVNFSGLCQFICSHAMPLSNKDKEMVSEDLLPYKTTAFRCLRDLLNSLPADSSVELRIQIYEQISPSLLKLFDQSSLGKDLDKRHPPVLVAGAMDCLGALFWEGIGSNSNTNNPKASSVEQDPRNLALVLKEAGNAKSQPAWTVRESAARCLAQLARCCHEDSIILHHTLTSAFVSVAKQTMTDRKFWRVRFAGLKILEQLTNRAGLGAGSQKNKQARILEALLPHKEVIVGVVRSCLANQESESQVTALSTSILANMNWWP